VDREVTREVIAEKLDRISDQLEHIDLILTGNGDPSKGLVVRVDRLEQKEAVRSKQLWAVWTAIIGGGVASLWK
jgi:hypothetical protein